MSEELQALEELKSVPSYDDDGEESNATFYEWHKEAFDTIEKGLELLEIFKKYVRLVDWGEETDQHHKKYFNKGFRYTIGTSNPNCESEQIDKQTFDKLKNFLGDIRVMFIKENKPFLRSGEED